MQKILTTGYALTRQLEKEYSVLQDRPTKLNLHYPEHQMIIKRFIGQLNEELVEWYTAETDEERIDEAADILNFAMSIMLMLDCEIYELDEDDYPFSGMLKLFILWNDVSHKLKNRPWKKTQVLTCLETIEPILFEAFNKTIGFLLQHHTEDEIVNAIESKHKKNLFRLKSNY